MAFPEPEQLYEVVRSDWLFRMPSLKLAEAQLAAGGTAYLFELTWPAPGMAGALGACHGLDVPLVFGNLTAGRPAMLIGDATAEAEALSEQMRTAWVAFATTGDPGMAGVPHRSNADLRRPAGRHEIPGVGLPGHLARPPPRARPHLDLAVHLLRPWPISPATATGPRGLLQSRAHPRWSAAPGGLTAATSHAGCGRSPSSSPASAPLSPSTTDEVPVSRRWLLTWAGSPHSDLDAFVITADRDRELYAAGLVHEEATGKRDPLSSRTARTGDLRGELGG